MSDQDREPFSFNPAFNTSMSRAVTFFGDTSLTSYVDGDSLFSSIWRSGAKFEMAEEFISPVPFLSLHLENSVMLRCKSPDRIFQSRSNPGDLCLTPGNITHSFSWDNSATLMILSLSQESVDSIALEFTRTDPAQIEITQHFTFQDSWLEATSRQIYAEVRAGLPYGRTYLDSLSRAMTAHILRHYSNLDKQEVVTVPKTDQLTKKQLRRVDDYIQEHLSQEKALLVDKLAAAANLPESRFYRAFRETTGMRPHEYIIQARLERAKAMLLDKNRRESLSVIASQVGFADQAHMTRLFKEKLGITPTQIQHGIILKPSNMAD